MKKIIESYYITGENGSYLEAEFDNGEEIIADTVAGIWGIEGGLTIQEVIQKYGEGKKMKFEDTNISDEISEEKLRKYVGY